MFPVLIRQRGLESSEGNFFDNFFTEEWKEDSYYPNADVYEDEKNVYVEVDIAGLDKKDIKIELDNNVLSIKGERTERQRTEKETYYCEERSSGKFERRFNLGNKIQGEQINADYKNGVLKITVPKKEESKATQIEIA
jgi:HSP20 family protein